MSETLRGLDHYLTTEPDPYAGRRRVPCDHCTAHYATSEEIGPFRLRLCDDCAARELRPKESHRG